jgi:hypothetical protein
MNLIRQCFDQQNKALMQRLVGVDFSLDQARQFLPEAALGLCLSSQKTSEFQTIASLFTKSHYQLLRNIDVDAIAKNTGIDAVRVTIGLHAIAPLLLQAYAQKSNSKEPATV